MLLKAFVDGARMQSLTKFQVTGVLRTFAAPSDSVAHAGAHLELHG
jgi:hypothetical protein